MARTGTAGRATYLNMCWQVAGGTLQARAMGVAYRDETKGVSCGVGWIENSEGREVDGKCRIVGNSRTARGTLDSVVADR